MFCKLTGDLPEAMDKGWQGRTALLRSLIRERTRALHRYSLWDAAIWEKSRLAIIRENNSSWSQHCQSRNYPLTQWHWLRLLATFIKFGAVTQGLSLVTVVFIGVTEPCPQDRTQLCQTTHKHTTKKKVLMYTKALFPKCSRDGKILHYSCTKRWFFDILGRRDVLGGGSHGKGLRAALSFSDQVMLYETSASLGELL